MAHPTHFRNCYRMSADTFSTVVEMLVPYITKQDTNFGDAIIPQEKILITVRFVSSHFTFINNGRFPDNFIFGAATAAYQIEGAWNIDGKGENIWDNFTHRVPSPISDGKTGDVACNSYYRYKEDVRLARELNLQMYRFSISWARILPTGYSNKINQKGLDYYKNLVKEIRKYNMIPAATIYHWDLPQRLYDDGLDWTNVNLIPHFVNYAKLVIKNLPEVGIWFTINEPKQVCHFGYGTGMFAPGLKSDGLLEYQCSYVIVKAHAAVYRMYKKEFPNYKAKMSLTVECPWIEPLTNHSSDEEAAERQRQFECGLYFNPIFSAQGDWPKVVKDRIRTRSLAANLTKSRLPDFTNQEIADIRGTFDFLGLNHYYTILADDVLEGPANETSYTHDVGVANSFDPSWIVESNGFFVIVPYGARKILHWIKKTYGNKPILITEIGMSENGTTLNDVERVDFYSDYFCNILEAMRDGVNVIGITFWSLIDNFEWALGYTSHFGLYYININDPYLRRIPKRSSFFVRKLMIKRSLECKNLRREWIKPMRLPSHKLYKLNNRLHKKLQKLKHWN